MFWVGLNRILGRLTGFWLVWLVLGGLGGFWLVWLDSYFRINDHLRWNDVAHQAASTAKV